MSNTINFQASNIKLKKGSGWTTGVDHLKLVNDIWDDIFYEFKDRVDSGGEIYHFAKVFRQPPNEPYLPHIQMEISTTPISETLDKKETKYRINVEVNIYAQDSGKIRRREIARLLEEYTFDYLYNEYGLSCTFKRPIPHVNENIHRITMRFRGVHDIDTGIIYRN